MTQARMGDDRVGEEIMGVRQIVTAPGRHNCGPGDKVEVNAGPIGEREGS